MLFAVGSVDTIIDVVICLGSAGIDGKRRLGTLEDLQRLAELAVLDQIDADFDQGLCRRAAALRGAQGRLRVGAIANNDAHGCLQIEAT